MVRVVRAWADFYHLKYIIILWSILSKLLKYFSCTTLHHIHNYPTYLSILYVASVYPTVSSKTCLLSLIGPPGSSRGTRGSRASRPPRAAWPSRGSRSFCQSKGEIYTHQSCALNICKVSTVS